MIHTYDPEYLNMIHTPHDFMLMLNGLIFFSEGDDVLLGHLVGVLSAHIGDDSPSVRRLCVKGLVQVDSSLLFCQICDQHF